MSAISSQREAFQTSQINKEWTREVSANLDPVAHMGETGPYGDGIRIGIKNGGHHGICNPPDILGLATKNRASLSENRDHTRELIDQIRKLNVWADQMEQLLLADNGEIKRLDDKIITEVTACSTQLSQTIDNQFGQMQAFLERNVAATLQQHLTITIDNSINRILNPRLSDLQNEIEESVEARLSNFEARFATATGT